MNINPGTAAEGTRDRSKEGLISMSLYGAMLTGVSALDANSRALSVTSSNIANVNTTGYKTTSSAFSTYLSGSTGQSSSASVSATSTQNLTQQGSLTSTSSSTDLAISGNGFFVVNGSADGSGTTYYTRDGSFSSDANGNLVNSSGYYLMGWSLDANGNVPANQSNMEPVNLSNITQNASPTTEMDMRANLQASTTADSTYTAGDVAAGNKTADFEQTFNVYDSQGGSQPMKMSFVKTDANTWSYELTYEGDSANVGGNNLVATGTLTFNSDGTLASPASGSVTATIPWSSSTGLQSQDVALNFGTVGKTDGVSQFDSASSMTTAGVNGAPSGSLTSVSIDDKGTVTAQFNNGMEQKVYKLPLATFPNANGLEAVSGNAYKMTENSGTAAISQADTGGAGTISSSSLESSTVDLASQFADLITTQRAYSAASRIVTTADDMMQELMNLKQR
jgi:flagellar hook protein FlgE